eukprot:586308-Prymnesium_polylepis.1
MVRAPWASGSVWQRLAASGSVRQRLAARLAASGSVWQRERLDVWTFWHVWPASGASGQRLLGRPRLAGAGSHGHSPLKHYARTCPA